ncbi:MAG: hypothetical protein ACK526_01700 [Planctomyces sp.]|jgi:hypothetical protein
MNASNSRRTLSVRNILLVQIAVIAAFAVAWFLLPDFRKNEVRAELLSRAIPVDVPLTENRPIRVSSLHNDPEVVTDEELAAVLTKVAPRFGTENLRPNYVEHALRIWGSSMTFQSPGLMSGKQMTEFLTDSAKYMESWSDRSTPILDSVSDGVTVRWGGDRSASVHHDHLLACLTEAGVPLDTPVFTMTRRMEFRDVLKQALRDFHVDEMETEWSIMAFGFWLAPQGIASWHNGEGREISFDLLAKRLMRNIRKHGVCLGTHRVYSLMVLLRLNETYGGHLIQEETKKEITEYLEEVRDLISVAQAADGSWPPNWTDGAEAEAKKSSKEKPSQRVIATGHHLEWLAIAPLSLHPDRAQIRRAADWAIKNTIDTPQSVIDENYTFYSHVGNCLALWRQTTPAEFWAKWRETHPDCEKFADPVNAPEGKKPASDSAAPTVSENAH